MSREKEYESALIEVWKNLRELRPVDFKEPDGEAETRAERAYYAAENALHKQVVAVEDWGWWFKVGETYTVRPFKYKATRGATIDYCFCLECQEERAGKEMFDMYECLDDAHRGSIIPVVACRDVVRVNADNE